MPYMNPYGKLTKPVGKRLNQFSYIIVLMFTQEDFLIGTVQSFIFIAGEQKFFGLMQVLLIMKESDKKDFEDC